MINNGERLYRRVAVAVIGLALQLCGYSALAQDADLSVPPDFAAAALIVDEQASYLRADGSIAIVGYNDMAPLLASLNALFVKSHPGTRFSMQLNGTATAVPALAHGVSAFAPMGAEFSNIELSAYAAIVGAPPLQFRIAHCTLDAGARSAPIAIFVHPSNPLTHLTETQLTQIFSTGSDAGDISRWGQLGLTGEWVRRRIYPAGIAEEQTAGLAMYMLNFKLSGRPFPATYNALFQSTDVIRFVAENPHAIGFAAAHLAHPGVRALAIADAENSQPFLPTTENIVNDTYPLNRHLYIYARKVSGQTFDPLVKEYLRLALSREGQAAIATARPGYLPLSAREVAEELAKLEQQE